jgi:hypothetical protein
LEFELKHVRGIVSSVSPRQAGEEADLLCSVGLSLSDVPAGPVAAALGCEVELLHAMFENGDGIGPTLFSNLKSLVAIQGWKRKHEIKIGSSKKVRTMSITGFKASPKTSGLFDVEFVATIEQLPDGYVEDISRKLQTGVWIDLIQVEAELPLRQKEKSAEDLKAIGDAVNAAAPETQDTLDLQAGKKRRGRPPKAKTE